jgi:hypothetical protein
MACLFRDGDSKRSRWIGPSILLVAIGSSLLGLDLLREFGVAVMVIAAIFEIKRLVDCPVSTVLPISRKICLAAKLSLIGIGGIVQYWILVSQEPSGIWIVTTSSLVWAAIIAHWVGDRGWGKSWRILSLG